MAFYKKIGEDWFEANKVSNSNYTLDENNKQSIDGRQWHDNPPEEYLDWVEEQENIEEEQLIKIHN